MTKKANEPKPIVSYKGFDQKFCCRGFQYEIGKSYEQDDSPVPCETGFHACEYPLDTFDYYAPGCSQYAKVEQSGECVKEGDKTASSKIAIKASLTISDLVSASIEYTTSRCDPVNAKHATGYQSASSATGNRSASSATGYNSIAAAFGLESKAKAGKTGLVIVAWWDEKSARKRLCVGYVGEDGIEPDVWYKAHDGKLVKSEDKQ